MNNEHLAPIFLDNKPVDLKDPKPRVSAVLSAGGSPGVTGVKWLQTQAGSQGTFLRPDHTLDRTSTPTKAIYLSSLARNPAAQGKTAIAEESAEAPRSLLPWPAEGKKGNAPAGAGGKVAGKADDETADEADDGLASKADDELAGETDDDAAGEDDDESSPKSAQ